MSKKLRTILLCLAAVLSAFIISILLPGSAAQTTTPGIRPNILFVFTDDHAAHAISAYGSRINRTPNLDRLAKGKWHLKTDPTGFDHWQIMLGQGTYYNPEFKTASGTSRYAGLQNRSYGDI